MKGSEFNIGFSRFFVPNLNKYLFFDINDSFLHVKNGVWDLVFTITKSSHGLLHEYLEFVLVLLVMIKPTMVFFVRIELIK